MIACQDDSQVVIILFDEIIVFLGTTARFYVAGNPAASCPVHFLMCLSYFLLLG